MQVGTVESLSVVRGGVGGMRNMHGALRAEGAGSACVATWRPVTWDSPEARTEKVPYIHP